MITRPEGKSLNLDDITSKFNIIPVIVKALRVRELDFDVEDFDEYSSIVFLSEIAVDIFLKKYKDINNKKIFCIGSKTALKVKSYGFDVTHFPNKFDSTSLGKSLISMLKGNEKILIIRSKKGSNELYEILSKKFFVKELYVYDLLPPDKSEVEKFERNIDDSIGVIFTSSLSVKYLIENLKEDSLEKLRKKILISIGPKTCKTLKEYGFESIYPKKYTIEECITLLKNLYDISNIRNR